MAPSLDFNATLAEQLRDAGMQMRAMTKPQKQRATPDVTPDATADAAPETANVTDAPTATPTTGATPETTTAGTVGAAADGAAAADNTTTARKNAHSTGQDKPDRNSPDLGLTLGKALAEASAEVQAFEAAEVTVTADTPRDSHGAAISSDAHSSQLSAGDGTAHSHTAESAHSDEYRLRDTLPNSNVNRHSAQDSHAAVGATTGGATDGATGAADGVSTVQDVVTTVHEAVAGAVTPTNTTTPSTGVAKTDGVTATGTASSASAHGDGHSAADTFRHQRQDSFHNTAEDSETNRHNNSHASNHTNNQRGSLGEHATVDGGLAPSLPDAASELWAMSQHSEAPTLSERSWTGGVRGAVLDALRGLAGGRDHVLVNLKRLATHTGISYGSVRNAMSRLTRSGDIRTRQIRMADGHGVRVEFLTLPGQEGTGVAAPGMVSSQAAVLGQAPALIQGMTQAAVQTQGMAHATQPYGHEPYHHSQGGAFATYGAQHTQGGIQGDAPTAYAGASHASPTQGTAQQTVAYTAQGTAQHTAFHTVSHAAQPSAHRTVTVTAENYADDMTDYHTQGLTPVTGGESGAPPTHYAPTHYAMPAGSSHMTTALQGMTPTQQSMTPVQTPMTPSSAPATFWDTADSLFALAWPHVAAAGLHMEHLRALAPIFTVQGFDPAVLPRTLRYLDWELEQQGMPEEMDDGGVPAAPAALMDAARQLTQSYLRAMQRRGTWPRPLGYEEGDD